MQLLLNRIQMTDRIRNHIAQTFASSLESGHDA